MKKINKKFKKVNRERGITLIALVITIVILIILAVVSIAMLTGEDGLISQANKATELNAHSTVYEALQLEVADYNIEKYKVDNIGDIIDFIRGKGKIDDDSVVDVEELLGSNILFGNGNTTDGDYYKIETAEENGQIQYKVVYYGSKNTPEWEKELMQEIEGKPSIGILADVVEVGDYINYAPTYTNTDDIKEGLGNGWRVAYVDSSSGVVTLVTEGVPLIVELSNGGESSNCQSINFNYEEINNYFDNTVANNIDILELSDVQLLCDQAGYNLTHSTASIGSPNWSEEEYTIDNDDLNILLIETNYVINTTGINGYGNQGYFYYSESRNNKLCTGGYGGNIGVRLVIDLKSNLEYYGGEGTQENPYQIY